MSTSFFEYYNLPISIEIDIKELRKKFLLRSRTLHPDFHSGLDEEKQKALLDDSSFNNEAYITLSDESRRIAHILRYSGRLDGSEKMTPEFLMEMMDINESLLDAQIGDHDALAHVTGQIQEKIEANSKQLNELSDFFSPDNEDHLNQLESIYLEKKYLVRLVDQLTET